MTRLQCHRAHFAGTLDRSTGRFLALLGGVEAPDAFFSGRNITRLVGLGGMIRMAMSGSRAVSPSRSQVGH